MKRVRKTVSARLVCCLALCISLLLAACGREEGTSGGGR